MAYAVNSYLPYMRGDDEAVELLDKEFSDKMEKEKGLLESNLKGLDDESKNLELELQRLKSQPSEKEVFEKQRKDLEGDLGKFDGYVASLKDANSITEKALQEKEKELAAKMDEIRRTREENEELKKKIEAQGINLRDAERMKRELMALEEEISEAEVSRSSWEEKTCRLDIDIRQKLKELELLSLECNQALKRYIYLIFFHSSHMSFSLYHYICGYLDHARTYVHKPILSCLIKAVLLNLAYQELGSHFK